MPRVGARLRQFRQALGWSQDELGKRLKMTAATVSRYETGDLQIDADDLPVVAAHLGVHPADFFLESGHFVPPLEGNSREDAAQLLRHSLVLQGLPEQDIDLLLDLIEVRRRRLGPQG
jgi:transcriptional regulator with XRE-family HTH domain